MNEIFKTTDFYLANALITVGYPIYELVKIDNKRVEFVFLDSEAMQEDIRRYWNDELEVKANKLMLNYKTLKNRVNEKLRG